ncbi:MAG: phosphodiester glycosidase family protein [Spirulinaceae cyanobacterium]
MKQQRQFMGSMRVLIVGLLAGLLTLAGANQLLASREEPIAMESAALQTVDPQTFAAQRYTLPSGMRWQQQYVAVGSSRFPVFWLELDLRNPQVELRPIWSNSTQMQGTRLLAEMGRQWRTLAAINGGFFNRNNRLPLGAIRREGRWYSGPILNRGVVAWDDAGNVQMSRLSLQEILTTETGQRFEVTHLNSGYVKAGVARYTRDWGPSYQPLTDNETVITVQANRVSRQDAGGTAGSRRFPIPAAGYLLVFRSYQTGAAGFPVGRQVTLESQTNPAHFERFPYMIGGGPLLLSQGQVVLNPGAEQFSAAFGRQAASRSFIGQTAQGTLVLGVVHNRPNGAGPTLRELTQLCQRLGLVNALNLDGGSSSSFFLNGQIVDRDPRTAARVHNGIGIYVP